MQQVFPFSVIRQTAGMTGVGEKPMKKQLFRTVTCLILGATLFFCTASFRTTAAESYYVENEWNYVDGSMDVSKGIPQNATGVLDRIRRKGVLRVATEPYFAPFEFIDPEQLNQHKYVGADMELAALIAKRLGVALEIVPMEFTQVLPALTENQCDLTISAIAYTPSRASAYALSKGYYFPPNTASTGFIIRQEDEGKITSLEDLADKTIIAQSSSLQEALASKHIINYKEFRRVSSLQAVYEAVSRGKADAGIVDMETASNYIRNNKDSGLILADGLYFILEEQHRGHRIAAKKGELQLIYFVNGVIDEVLEDGTYISWLQEAQKRAAELGI